LLLPGVLRIEDRHAARRLLASLPAEMAQQVADEWAAQLRRRTIRSPLAYLTTLVKRARSGSFEPELAREELVRREAANRSEPSKPSRPECAGNPPGENSKTEELRRVIQEAADHLRVRY